MDYKHRERLFAEFFFKPTFNVDEFLSQCTSKSELLTIREDLKQYGSRLYSVMVDILKTETERIINLAENLTHLNATIEQLHSPMSQLSEEIKTLYLAINSAKSDFKEHLDKVESITFEKNCLNLKIGIFSSASIINNIILSWEKDADITTLERAINEYSFQYLYLSELGLESVVVQSNTHKIVTRLLELLDGLFLTAFKEQNEETILSCLRMYMNLVKQEVATECFRKHVVEPGVQSIFNQKNLDYHNQDVNMLYKLALQFLNDKLGLLLKILRTHADLGGFSFITDCFWQEVDKQICDNLPNITAPGNPQLFQRRFKDTWNFLEQISLATGNPDLFKSNSSVRAHMKRFNLPVYFEIVFQQISVKFETEMLFQPKMFCEFEWQRLLADEGNLFKLKMTDSLWHGIKQCFDESVFLNHVGDQFMKLMMLLVSRYMKWFDTILVNWDHNTPFIKSVTSGIEKFIIYAMLDFQEIKKLLIPPQNIDGYDSTIFHVVDTSIRPNLTNILNLHVDVISNIYSRLQKQLIRVKVNQFTEYFEQVTSIPRLYRRTNRTVPNQPSSYVFATVSNIATFHRKFKDILDHNIIGTVIDRIIADVAEQYLSVIQEVLYSVQKTEESLRRLKNRSLNLMDEAGAQTSREATSDEAKIREQIKRDVQYFITNVSTFTLEVSKPMVQRLLKESLRENVE